MPQFSKVLIANRGEIAVRIIKGCQALGYPTVAVYSDADVNATHVQLADQATVIGPAPAAQSYLCIDKILAAAQQTGADAIHPGYGFLAENADFARACEAAGIVFIGPGAEAIELMGNKRAAKIRMLAAGVPCVPGYEGADQSDDVLVQEAQNIGLPVMIKAAAGGGGRGMRLCNDASQLQALIQSARSEAQSAFGSGELILEKAVTAARHVEIQVFADEHGNVLHLGERDCSIQRRHQKVIEECPSPAVSDSLREQMGAAAVAAAAEIGYRGAGTVEFLLDGDGHSFYFLEMNTRLQVEHPVTELVTGVDLVQWQLQVAAGQALPMNQQALTLNGHAIEVRLCAEDPYNNFMPQTGTISHWHCPATIRADHCISGAGQQISPFYDSMVGKLIAHGPDRESARRQLLRALQETQLFGVISNRDFLLDLLSHSQFADGHFHTGFIAEHYNEQPQAPELQALDWALAALSLYLLDSTALNEQTAAELLGWQSSLPMPTPLELQIGEQQQTVLLTQMGAEQFQLQVGSTELDVNAKLQAQTLHYRSVHGNGRCVVQAQANQLWLANAQRTLCISDLTHAPASAADDGSDGRVLAPMDGKILAVHIQPGDTVSKGQTLVVLEAMKMEHQLNAGADGVVESVNTAEGEQVSQRQLLAQINAD